MGAATSEGSQAPARQGHFVVMAELPEIQTVTVWTPCCAPMSTLSNKKTWMDCLSGSLSEGCADVEDKYFRWNDTGKGLYLLYIAIYMYNLMLYPDKNVWWEWQIIPYFATSTTRNASDGRLSNRVNDTRCLLIILWHPTVIDWLTNQSHNWIPVKLPLILSAIDSALCVDGKCYRPSVTVGCCRPCGSTAIQPTFHPTDYTPVQSIAHPIIWLRSCAINRLIGWSPD